jgi:hypothetical protein
MKAKPLVWSGAGLRATAYDRASERLPKVMGTQFCNRGEFDQPDRADATARRRAGAIVRRHHPNPAVNNQQRRARFDRYIARLDFRAFDESVEGPQRFQLVVLGGKWSAQPATQANGSSSSKTS